VKSLSRDTTKRNEVTLENHQLIRFLQQCTVECYENEDCYYASAWIRLNDMSDKCDYTAVLKNWLEPVYAEDEKIDKQTLYFYCSLHTAMSSDAVRKTTTDSDGRWASHLEDSPEVAVDGDMMYSHIWQKRLIDNDYYCSPNLCPTSPMFEMVLQGSHYHLEDTSIYSDLLQKQPSGLSDIEYQIEEIEDSGMNYRVTLERCKYSCSLNEDVC